MKQDQWPAERHRNRCNSMFGEGHADSVWRSDAVNPRSTTWRARWNNDDDPHWEIANWTGDNGNSKDECPSAELTANGDELTHLASSFRGALLGSKACEI